MAIPSTSSFRTNRTNFYSILWTIEQATASLLKFCQMSQIRKNHVHAQNFRIRLRLVPIALRGDNCVLPVTLLFFRWHCYSSGDIIILPVTLLFFRWHFYSSGDIFFHDGDHLILVQNEQHSSWCWLVVYCSHCYFGLLYFLAWSWTPKFSFQNPTTSGSLPIQYSRISYFLPIIIH